MLIYKTPKADQRAKYKRVIEISLIVALGFLVVAFKYFPDIEAQEVQLEGPQELFQVEDIQQTKQENRPTTCWTTSRSATPRST